MAKKDDVATILIIEDEAEVLSFAARTLELEGYRIFQAKNGEEGMKLVTESPISLVLLDLRLPEPDGWAILEQMKGKPELAMIPVVVFTASAAESQRDRALSMGAAAYLIKPLGVATLRDTIARILHRKR